MTWGGIAPADLPPEFVRLLLALAAEVEHKKQDVLNCWLPRTEIVDTGEYLAEKPCGECAPCELRAALDRLQSWQGEHDFWPSPESML